MCISKEDFNDLGQGIRTLIISPFQKITFLPKTPLDTKDNNTAREVFDTIDINHFIPITYKTRYNIDIGSIVNTTLPVGTPALNINATAENKKAANKLYCSVSWGIKRFSLEYARKTINLSETALRILEKSVPLFVRIYGDSYVSKVILGARWDATIEFSQLTIDKKRFIASKLELHSTAKGVIDSITHGELKQYKGNDTIRVVVQISRIGGIKTSLVKQIKNLESIIDLYTKKKLEIDLLMMNSDADLDKGKLTLTTLQNDEKKLKSDKEIASTLVAKLIAHQKKNQDEISKFKKRADHGGLQGEQLSAIEKQLKTEEDNLMILSADLKLANDDLNQKEAIYLAILAEIANIKKKNDLLEEGINHQRVEQKVWIEKLKNENELLLKLKHQNIQQPASESLYSKIFGDKMQAAVMTVDEFLKFYNSTLNDIEQIREKPQNYSFYPVEYEATPYYQVVEDPEKSERLLSLYKAVTAGKDIIILADRCKEEIEKKLNLLQMSEPNPTMRPHRIQNYIKAILNYRSQIDDIKKIFIETACMEQETEVTDALNRLKKIILELNSLEESKSFIEIKKNYPAIILSSKRLHQGKNDKKESTEDGRHHWHENAFYISNFNENITCLVIAVTGEYWGTLKFGYKNSQDTFVQLAQIDTKSKDKKIKDDVREKIAKDKSLPVIKDSDKDFQKEIQQKLTYIYSKIEERYIVLPASIRKDIISRRIPFIFRHAFEENIKKPNTLFTVKIFTLEENIPLNHDCIDKYLYHEKITRSVSFSSGQPISPKMANHNINLIQSNVNFENNIYNVSAIANNCGLFALTLGIKLALQKNPKFKNTVKLPYNFELISEQSLLSPGNIDTLAVGQQLRHNLYQALLTDVQHKEERYNSFLTACCQILEGKKTAPDINTFITANEEYIQTLKANWLKFESTIIKVYHENKNFYYLNNSKAIEQQLIKEFAEFLSELVLKPEDSFEKALDQYFLTFKDGDTILSRYITFYHAIESAWKTLQAGSALQRNQLRNAIVQFYNKTEAFIFSSNVLSTTAAQVAAPVYTSTDYLLRIALLREMNFKENGSADPMPSDDQVLSTSVKIFVENTLLREHWLRIYINYCNRIKEGIDLLSVDELGCLARAWNINLKIKFGNNRAPYSTVSKGDNLLQITLCNPSQMHWMYEDVLSPDENENTNKKIDEATKEISALISKLNNLELKKRIIEAINEKEAYERREKDFSYITGIISAIIDFPIILKNQKKGSISAADEAIITKLYELFESKGQFKLTAEAIYQLAQPLKNILEDNIKPLLFSPNTNQPQSPPLTTLQANSLTIGNTGK